MYDVKLNENGTVTWWSVYQQRYQTAFPAQIPDAEYAAMTDEERERIAAHKASRWCHPCFDATI